MAKMHTTKMIVSTTVIFASILSLVRLLFLLKKVSISEEEPAIAPRPLLFPCCALIHIIVTTHNTKITEPNMILVSVIYFHNLSNNPQLILP